MNKLILVAATGVGAIAAVLGATGLVGREMLRLLEERDFPLSELLPLGSPASGRGRTVVHAGREVEVLPVSREALERARSAFVETHHDDAALLAGAIAQGDRDTAAHLAHRLKGGALTIGAEEIAAIAVQLEQSLADSGQPASAFNDLVKRLSAALAAFR